MAAMYGNGGGGKAARAEKKENKKIGKEVAKAVKSVTKSMAKAAPKKEKGISLKERADKMAATKGRLAQLDVVSMPLKPSARREMFRNQRKGK
jgi:hypothetical protein